MWYSFCFPLDAVDDVRFCRMIHLLISIRQRRRERVGFECEEHIQITMITTAFGSRNVQLAEEWDTCFQWRNIWLLRLASLCDFEELKRVILNWRVQRSIPGDNYVIDKLIVLILAFIIDRRYILCVADSSIQVDEVYPCFKEWISSASEGVYKVSNIHRKVVLTLSTLIICLFALPLSSFIPRSYYPVVIS